MKGIILAVLLLFGCGSHGPTYSETEFPVRNVTVNGVTYGYRVYVPAGRRADEKLPVMLYLHGSNRIGTNNQDQLSDLAENIKGYPERFSFIVVVPQCRPNTFWAGPMMEQSLAVLDRTVEEFNGDPSRLYLAGYSMGGFGLWQMAITHPDKFAALVPVAGGVEPMGRISDGERALLSPQVAAAAGAPDTYKAYAEALSKIPAWLVHGSADNVVPIAGSQKLAAALKAAGNPDVVYNELAGVGHGSVVQAFEDPKLFEWLAKQRRSDK